MMVAKLAREIHRRNEFLTQMQANSFPEQWAFVTDTSRLIAALCTRRAGKSMGAAARTIKKARAYPGCNFLYIALTRETARGIIWKDCLQYLLDKYKIRHTFNRSRLVVTLRDGGSEIYLFGVDANRRQAEKALGRKYKEITVDEGASYEIDLDELVSKYLRPATIDLCGSIVMIGTPGNRTHNLFYRVTNGKVPGWSVHRWTAFDNRFVAEQWALEIATLKAENPGIERTTGYQQMMLGKWVVDESRLVYQFEHDRNTVAERPKSALNLVLGVDLGFNDASAFVLCAYSYHDPNLYIIKAYKRSEMTITDVANVCRALETMYGPMRRVVDGASKQAVQELIQRQGLHFETAEKTGKADFISLMNDDFSISRIKLLEGETEQLSTEYSSLVWDEKKFAKHVREEDASCPNHLADAALYAWRYCYNYLSRELPMFKVKTDEDQVSEFWDHEEEAGEQEEQEEKHWWDAA